MFSLRCQLRPWKWWHKFATGSNVIITNRIYNRYTVAKAYSSTPSLVIFNLCIHTHIMLHHHKLLQLCISTKLIACHYHQRILISSFNINYIHQQASTRNCSSMGECYLNALTLSYGVRDPDEVNIILSSTLIEI